MQSGNVFQVRKYECFFLVETTGNDVLCILNGEALVDMPYESNESIKER